MVDYLRRTNRDTDPLASRTMVWGVGGLLVGLVIGVLGTLLGLYLLAPHPQAASPDASETSGEIGITVDDVYLTQVLADAMSNDALPIHLIDIQAEIQPGNLIKLSGSASGQFPISAPLVATAQLRLKSGQPTIHIVSAQVGGLPLPGSITAALEGPINTRLAQTMADLLPPGSTITSLSTTEHHLLMTITQR